MSSLLQTLFDQAPSGQSPYAFAADRISQVLPEKVGWFFWLLGLGSGVNAINLVMNLVCIYMIGARKKLGETNPYWLIRLRYDHPSGVPYLVPNAVMMFLLFNGIFAFLMQPYIWINFVAYMHRSVAPNTGLFFWYGFIFVFDGSGMWISAFGTFYATLLPQLLVSNNTGNFRFMVHPTFLNILCYGLPTTLFVIQIVTSALSQKAWHEMVLLQFKVVSQLYALDSQWKSSNETRIDQTTFNNTLALADPLVDKILASRSAFVRNAITCGAWYLLCFIFFTPSATWLLYTLQRTVSRKLQFVTQMPESGGEIQFQVALQGLTPRPGTSGDDPPRTSEEPGSLHPPRSYREGNESEQTTPTSAVFLAPEHQDAVVPTCEEEARPPATEDEEARARRPHGPYGGAFWQVNKTARKLQTAYYSAMLQFIATGFCLGIAAGSWTWAAVDIRVMFNPTLHALAVLLTVWVYSVVGIIVNVFICIRLRAIGFHLPKSKLMGYLSGVLASSSSRDRRTAA